MLRGRADGLTRTTATSARLHGAKDSFLDGVVDTSAGLHGAQGAKAPLLCVRAGGLTRITATSACFYGAKSPLLDGVAEGPVIDITV